LEPSASHAVDGGSDSDDVVSSVSLERGGDEAHNVRTDAHSERNALRMSGLGMSESEDEMDGCDYVHGGSAESHMVRKKSRRVIGSAFDRNIAFTMTDLEKLMAALFSTAKRRIRTEKAGELSCLSTRQWLTSLKRRWSESDTRKMSRHTSRSGRVLPKFGRAENCKRA